MKIYKGEINNWKIVRSPTGSHSFFITGEFEGTYIRTSAVELLRPNEYVETRNSIYSLGEPS